MARKMDPPFTSADRMPSVILCDNILAASERY